MDENQLMAGLPALSLAVLAALLSALIIVALRPLMVRYALARPNARSAHREPTPQGGGIAVVLAAAIAVVPAGIMLRVGHPVWFDLLLVGTGALVMGVVGLVDDIWPLPPLPRLALQLVTVALVVGALPPSARVLPILPVPIERLLLIVGGAWFINLTNFMDGMDWMTVVGVVPATAALALFWHWGFLSTAGGLVALGLLGGLIGFAPFNKPVARLFLGDVGSLPIGLLMAYLLFDLAAHGGLAAALLLALYSIADSGITLIWRLRRGDKVWEAHRMHYYQVAVARGYSVKDVLVRVFAVNVALALFATASLLQEQAVLVLFDLGLGIFVVAKLLKDLSRGRWTQPM